MSSKKKKSDSMAGRTPRFPELPPKYSSSRELRNKAEKIRRDRLNKLIEEMRSLVPMICNTTKKSDTTRSTILRLTANFLRVTRLFPQDANSEGDQHSEKSYLGEGLPHLESMDGFFFILAEDGRVLYISENVDKYVGFSQIEMMGFPIFNFTHPADQSKLQSNLSKKGKLSPCPSPLQNVQATSPPQVPASYSSSNSHTLALPSSYQSNCEEKGPRQSFYIRLLQKPLAKRDNPQYEHMHVVGHLRKTEHSDDGNNSVSQNTFIGVMRPVRDRPITELSLMESIQDQYLTRHLPDGRIIYTDHRISTIAGYLPSEVKGKSAFNFFYAEDLPWTTMAMRHMFASSNGEGSTVYRLFTQTGELICLQTKGFLEFNKSTNKIESFLCINTVIRPEDADRYLNEQKDRFTPFITEVQINKMAALNQSSSPTLPSLQCSQEGSEPSVMQLLSSSAEVSFLSKSSITASSRKLLPTNNCDNSLKRQFLQISSDTQAENYQYREGPPIKKSVAPQSISNIQMYHKRKLDLLDDTQQKLQSSKIPPNWQYTPARGEPTHRTEEGLRVVDIEQQSYPEDNSHIPGYKQEKDQINFQGLINKLNETHKFKHSQDSNNPGFVAENSSQNHPHHPQLSDTVNQVIPTSVPGPRRVGSVIKMLPQRQKIVQDNSLERTDEHKPPFSMDNPSDTGVFLTDYLSPFGTNQQTSNSSQILADVIKEELLNSSSSEAERIADKLKVMLAPLSGHQNRQDQSKAVAQETQCSDSDMIGVQDVAFPTNQNQSNSDPNDSDLFEILNQDLIFSLDSSQNDQTLLSPCKDEVPSTSS